MPPARLVRVQPYGASPTTMTYNADGLRVRVEPGSGGTYNNVWDFQNMISPDNGASTRYAYRPGLYGDLLHVYRGANGSSFYLFDALGSTRQLTDDSQDTSDTYLYKAYGEELDATGSTDNPYRWVGEYGYQFDNQIAATFYQYSIRQRDYNPVIAAWMSEDPIVTGSIVYPGDTGAVTGLAKNEVIYPSTSFRPALFESVLSPYRYVQNSPISRIDPSGW